tara:strand:+ start:1081 stop:1695 length:615 start_codon:yes stop_codon:yes gene_type:complete
MYFLDFTDNLFGLSMLVFVWTSIFFNIVRSTLNFHFFLMDITAYQTLQDRENPDEIESNGPYKCRSANAWLGIGYYFWDSNIQWAHEWGEKSYSNDYIICEAGIVIDETCFDLVGNINHQMELIEIISLFKESGYLSDKGTVYLGQLIQLMKDRGVFDYKSIRANDNKRAFNLSFTKNNKEFTSLLKRTQICLVDKNKSNFADI